MFEYDKEAMMAAETLDKYDLTDVLKGCHGTEVYDVIDRIDAMGSDEVSKAITELSTDDLVIYLEKRYNMRSQEVSRYVLWWSSR